MEVAIGYPLYMFQWYGKATAGTVAICIIFKIMSILPLLITCEEATEFAISEG
jgi:hypothetical protein